MWKRHTDADEVAGYRNGEGGPLGPQNNLKRQNCLEKLWRIMLVDGTIESEISRKLRHKFQKNRDEICELMPVNCAGRSRSAN
jgi:hypothetical protein